MTICASCTHCRYAFGPYGKLQAYVPKGGEWYSYFCSKFPIDQTEVDNVTGGPRNKDLYQRCRVVNNNGECPLYEPKQLK